MADGILLLSTKVDLSGANEMTAGVTSALTQVRAQAASTGVAMTQMGEKANYSLMEARHGVMMLGEDFGVRLPRAVSSFIAHLGPIGAAMSAAFPILAIVALFDILGEKIISISEKPAKIAEAWDKYDETVFTSGEHIRSEIDKEEQKLIEMTDGPVAGLQFALQHLETTAFSVFKSITEDTTAAMAAMKEQASFTNVFGPAAKDLEAFREEVGKAMRTASAAHPDDPLAAYNAAIGLVQQKERELSALIAQRTAASGADASAAVNGLHAEREAVNDMLPLLQKGIELDNERRAVATQAVSDAGAKQADKMAQDQARSVKQGLDDEEAARTKARQEYINNLQETERLSIESTLRGSAARVAAIDAAITEEQAKGLQDEGFYRGLLTQRLQATQEEAQAEVQSRLKAIEDTEKIQASAAEQSARQALANIADQTKARQAAQAETYKEQTVQPFVAPSGRIEAAQGNADALVAIARNEATQEEAIAQESATKRIQALQAMVPQYTVAYAANQILAKDYADKVSEIERQVTELTAAESTKRVQIIDREREEETKIQEQLLQTYLQVKQQEEAAISGFVTSATGDLNNFAVTIATTVGEVNGKISETRYIQEQFGRMFIEIERQFYQMILKMIEDTTAFKAVESSIKGVFDSAFKAIGLIKVPPPQPAGIPGLAGGVPLQGGQIPGAATGTAQQTAANGALTEFTTALHTASAALAQNHSSIQSRRDATQVRHTSATQASTGATHGDVSATQLSTGATHSDVAATQLSTGATHTDVVATTVSTGSTTTNTAAVSSSTAAHAFHTPAVLVDAGAFISHEASVIADTIAMIAHKIASLFTGAQTGGLIQGPGTGTSDSIHMAVSHGEYIVKAAAVAQPGVLPMLHAINTGSVSGGKLQGPKAATGGLMDTAEYDNRVAAAMGGGGGDEGGGGSGGSPQFNSESAFHYHAGPVSALDQAGVGDVLNRNRGELTKIFHTAVKRGQIDIRQLLRRH